MDKHIKGIIFDLDGTLLDTLKSLAGAFNEALMQMACPTHPVIAYKEIIGDGARTAAIRCLPAHRQDEASIAECVRRFQAVYTGCWQENTAPYPGIEELLVNLKDRLPLAVLSNKDEVFTQQCVDYFFRPGSFVAAVGYSEKVKHKPDPAGALAIAKCFNCDPGEIILIGDTATDMRTADACNMVSVGVLWGFRDAHELRTSGAHHIVPDPTTLAKLLDRLID
jgi:phosphoglycolate phosphatase